jgi:hypothetical protein
MIQEDLILRPRPYKSILLGLLCLVFTIGGVYMAFDEGLKGFLIACFFGLGVLVAILQLIPGSNQLVLTKEGFTMTSLFRSHFIRWTDVDYFKPGYIGKSQFLLFDFSAEYKKHDVGKKIAKWISGKHAALPSNYGLSLQELSELMNEWMYRYKQSC